MVEFVSAHGTIAIQCYVTEVVPFLSTLKFLKKVPTGIKSIPESLAVLGVSDKGACTYNVSTKGGGGVAGLLTIANQGRGVVKAMLMLAGDFWVVQFRRRNQYPHT